MQIIYSTLRSDFFYDHARGPIRGREFFVAIVPFQCCSRTRTAELEIPKIVFRNEKSPRNGKSLTITVAEVDGKEPSEHAKAAVEEEEEDQS